jgi:hypothetical protein
MTRTIVALYRDIVTANEVVGALVDAGFSPEAVSLTAYDAGEAYARHLDEGAVEVEEMTGTAVGAAIGGLGGLLVGMSALIVPGVGPVLTAGAVGAALLSTGAGAALGGLIGALVDVGIPEEQAAYYAEGVRRGGTLVVVHAPEGRTGEAVAVMDRYAPVDVEGQVPRWRGEGWEGGTVEAPPYTREEVTAEMERWESPRVEEEPTTAYTRYYEGYPEEEHRFTPYTQAFRRHYDDRYKELGHPYDYYAPAYRHGYDMATGPEFQGREWQAVEPLARKAWEERYTEPWEEVDESVRYGYDYRRRLL